jgi:hypothetical protein
MKTNANQDTPERHDPREIPKWARRYAQNRMLPVAWLQVILLLSYGSALALLYLTKWAHARGERSLAVVFMVVLCGAAIWVLWFTFFRASAMVVRAGERVYRGEGSVSLDEMPAGSVGFRTPLPVLVFLFFVFVALGLRLLGLLPREHVQPVVAVCLVLFLLYAWVRLRAASGFFFLLWAGLLAVHEILLLAGAPIGFGAKYDALNTLLPVCGYSILAGLASHLYSRLALRRLRVLARSPEVAPDVK